MQAASSFHRSTLGPEARVHNMGKGACEGVKGTSDVESAWCSAISAYLLAKALYVRHAIPDNACLHKWRCSCIGCCSYMKLQAI